MPSLRPSSRPEPPRLDTSWSSASEIAAAVASGKISATAVVDDALARIAEHNKVLNAFTAVTAERARARARAIDATASRKQNPGPLAGVPFAVKNLFDVAGIATVAGSKINRADPPAERNFPLIEKLETAGAVLVGALNMGEYAYDFTGENVHYDASRNPHDPTRMSGGSSGGSGSAVGGGMVPLALGSDTNGSIRVPSSLCGIFGLKPTYGRLSRARSFPFVTNLITSGDSRAQRAIWRYRMMLCRALIPTMRPAPIVRLSRHCQSFRMGLRVCASPWRAAISSKMPSPKRLRRSTALPRRLGHTPRSKFPRRGARVPQPM